LNDRIQQSCHGDRKVREKCDGDADCDSQHPEAGLSIFQGSSEPARIIEMAYWSEEPGLLETIRAVACLSPETRAALHAFLSTATDARRIRAVNNQGDLVLSVIRIVAPGTMSGAVAEGA
jgi:hypothetical protein